MDLKNVAKLLFECHFQPDPCLGSNPKTAGSRALRANHCARLSGIPHDLSIQQRLEPAGHWELRSQGEGFITQSLERERERERYRGR